MSGNDDKVIALIEQKMEEAKSEMVKEMSNYLDWHLHKYRLNPVTDETIQEWKESKQ